MSRAWSCRDAEAAGDDWCRKDKGGMRPRETDDAAVFADRKRPIGTGEAVRKFQLLDSSNRPYCRCPNRIRYWLFFISKETIGVVHTGDRKSVV